MWSHFYDIILPGKVTDCESITAVKALYINCCAFLLPFFCLRQPDNKRVFPISTIARPRDEKAGRAMIRNIQNDAASNMYITGITG